MGHAADSLQRQISASDLVNGDLANLYMTSERQNGWIESTSIALPHVGVVASVQHGSPAAKRGMPCETESLAVPSRKVFLLITFSTEKHNVLTRA